MPVARSAAAGPVLPVDTGSREASLRAASGLDDRAALLRSGAVLLRSTAAESAVLLSRVVALDTESTWRSAWQRRCRGRIGDWRAGLDAGGRAARAWAERFELLAARAEDQAEALSRLAGAGPVGPRGVAPLAEVDPARRSGNAPHPVPGMFPAAFGPDPGGPHRRAPAPPPSPDGAPGAAAWNPPGAGEPEGEVSFDPERLAELAHQLRAAATRAGRAAGEIGHLEHRLSVTAATGAAGAVAGHALDAVREGLDLVAAEAPAMASAVDRRMAHFAAARDAVGRGGFLIDRPLWFTDAPAAPAAALRATVTEIAALIGTEPGRLGPRALTEVGEALGGLTPAGLQAIVSGLRGRPLAVLTAAITAAVSHVDFGTLRYLPAVTALGDLLLRGAPAAMVAELARRLPGLEPPLGGGFGPWRSTAGGPQSAGGVVLRSRAGDPVWARGAAPPDVGQGELGDCYLLAALIGVARVDPALLRRNLRENPNGTVTVTFHGRGVRPPVVRRRGVGTPGDGTIAVTVTRDFPVRPASGQEIAADADNAEGDPELWVALYEKAYARMAGSYAGIEGGDPAVAMEHLTGLPVTRADPSEVGFDDLAARLTAGDVLTVTTVEEPSEGAGLVGRHAYAVLAVDRASGMVQLRNPWDPAGGGDRRSWHRWEELEGELAGVRWGPTRPPPASPVRRPG